MRIDSLLVSVVKQFPFIEVRVYRKASTLQFYTKIVILPGRQYPSHFKTSSPLTGSGADGVWDDQQHDQL